jgi:branched-chain amino acid transport system permease protein
VARRKRFSTVLLFLALAILTYLFVSRFNSIHAWWAIYRPVLFQSLMSGLLMGAIYSLLAMGLTLIFGVLNLINFAHGTLMTVSMYTTFWLFKLYGIDPYLSLFFTIPLLFVIGALIHRLIIQPVLDAPMHNQLLITLGLSLLIMNLLLILFSAEPMTIRTSYSGASAFVGNVMISLPRLAAFATALCMVVILFFLMHHTDLGKAIRASADDKEGAALSGINVRRMYLFTFGLGTACVGAAGTVIMPFFVVDPHAGETFNILSYVIVVLGGMGSMLGAFLGGLIVGLTESVGAVFLPGSSKLVGVFFLFILILLFRPEGLLMRSRNG